MRKNFVGLDLVRFALAVYLMVFHTIHDYPQAERLPFIELADLGGFATSSFFILSGFILTHLYVDETREIRGGTRSFFVKRLSNLYPIHWLGLFLFVLVSLASAHSAETFLLPTLTGGEQQVVQLGAVPATFTWLLNVFMLQAWDARVSSINGPSWSLSCLLFFYLLFPILGPRFANMRRRGLALVSLWMVYLVPPVTVVLFGMYGPQAVGTIEHNPPSDRCPFITSFTTAPCFPPSSRLLPCVRMSPCRNGRTGLAQGSETQRSPSSPFTARYSW